MIRNLDGIVDAGVVSDDDRTRMAKRIVIHDPRKPARLWLVVTPLPPLPTLDEARARQPRLNPR